MDVYNIDKTVTIADEYATDSTILTYTGAKEILENTVLPLVLQYDNVSLIGEYEEAENYTKKYVLDIGYEYLAIGFLIKKQYIFTIVCKKEDTNNLNYLYAVANATGSTSSSTSVAIVEGNTTNKTATVSSHMLRVISKNNKLNAFLGFVKDGKSKHFIFLDTDTMGNQYLCANTLANIYYDNDSYVTYSYETAEGSAYNPINEQYVLKKRLPIGRNNRVYSLAKNALYITCASISSTTSDFVLIDVEDVKYRQMTAKVWYIDS